MASGVWASNALVNNLFGGPQPETVLPGDSLAFARLDLKPSAGQLANYAQFVGKLPDSVREDMGDGGDPAKDFFEESFDYLDYEDEVEPWLGSRFGVAVFPSGGAEDGSGLGAAAAVAVTDEGAAAPALDRISAEEEVEYVFLDGFAVISETSGMLTEVETKVEEQGALADDPDFSADMGRVTSDSMAAGWADIGGLADTAGSMMGGSGFDDGYSSSPSLPELDVTGRMAAAVSVESDYAEVRGDLVDFSVADFALSDYTPSATGLSELGALPEDTVMAAAGSGLDELSAQAWNDLAGAMPDITSEAEAAMSQSGFSVPDDFGLLLGQQTAIGVTSAGGSEDFSDIGEAFQYRAAGADEAKVNELVASGDSTYSSPPGVSSEGGTVIVSSGSTSQGKLGDDPSFKQVMQGTENAVFGYYADGRAIAADDELPDADQYGTIGLTSAIEDGHVSSVARWAPSGG